MSLTSYRTAPPRVVFNCIVSIHRPMPGVNPGFLWSLGRGLGVGCLEVRTQHPTPNTQHPTPNTQHRLLARELQRTPRPAVIGAGGERKMYVCIDAGHGGPDAGVCGHGAVEKWIAGEVASRTGEILHTAGCLVFLTRVGDRKV